MACPRRIGVLTGGGDCPGLNAVLRAVTKTAIHDHGVEVLGIEDGFLGLIQNRIRPLTLRDVGGITSRGGTILGTSNKADPQRFAVGYDESGDPKFVDVTDRVLDHLKLHGIKDLVVIGGDGTMSGARNLVERGINCIGLPKTIDNDLMGTEITFGFSTAVQTAVESLDRIHTTAISHHRVMIVEVMGRNAGWIALHAGVASGSDIVLLPEIPYDLGAICDFVKQRERRGSPFSIACVSEGAKPKGGKQIVSRIDPTSPDPIRLGGISAMIAQDIERCSGIEARATILGHVLRGGSPVAFDRVLGTQLGHHAIRLLAEGKQNRVVVVRGNRLNDIDIREVANAQRLVPLDDPLIAAARSVGMCFGD